MMKDLSMHVLDIVQNSIRAQATNMIINIDEDIVNNLLSITISDNGCGMTEEFIQKVRNPFETSRTTRKVGLGIPMLEQTCIQSGGKLDIESRVDIGTTITATMELDNIDRPPLGDVGDAIYMTIVTNPELDFRYVHSINSRKYTIDTIEVKEILGDVPLTEPTVMEWIKQNIKEGLEEIEELKELKEIEEIEE